MRYILKRLVGKQIEVEINKEEFDKIKHARECLLNAFSIEEKYELLLSNYLDLEKECLNLNCEFMIKNLTGYPDYFDILLALNKRIVNLLTSARLYIDQVHSHAKACLPQEDENIQKIDLLFNVEYDKFFEYRFMEALRNFVQHHALAVHSAPLDSRWTSYSDTGEHIHFIKVLFLKSKVISDKNFKTKIKVEMPDKVELIYTSRVYIESISDIHCNVRSILNDVIAESRNIIKQYINTYSLVNVQNTLGLSAICINDELPNNKIVDEVPLLLEWDDIRLNLVQKNQRLTNLKRSVVSSSISYK